jgi:multiple sugar transport system ATP-binding protein
MSARARRILRDVEQSVASGLELTAIAKSFGGNRVLDNVSLTVRPGEFVSLVGPSGCGKSTLLRIIAGLEVQDAGSVAIGGMVVDALSPRARNIAMVFQSYALYPHMSASENIALPLAVGRLSLAERIPGLRLLSPRRQRIMREIADEVRAVATQLQIDPLLSRKPGQLSGGQRQRVALARAMVRKPTLFLMDEPLSNLDAQLRVHMRDELADLHTRLGATFIYVTHDQVEAMTMSTRVAMLDGGRIAQLGTPRELYDRPATLTVARFIGTPAINVLPATVAGDGRIAIDGASLPMKCPELAGAPSAFLCVRPEALRLLPAVAGSPQGRVRRVEHHGSERLIFVDIATKEGGTVIVREAAGTADFSALSPGTTISLEIDVERAHLFGPDGARMPTSGSRARADTPNNGRFPIPAAGVA